MLEKNIAEAGEQLDQYAQDDHVVRAIDFQIRNVDEITSPTAPSGKTFE